MSSAHVVLGSTFGSAIAFFLLPSCASFFNFISYNLQHLGRSGVGTN